MENDNFLHNIQLIEKENIILNSLIVSTNLMQSIESDENNILNAYIKLKPQTKKFNGFIQLVLYKVKKFYWYWANENDLGYVERYKLLNVKNSIYLSLDPFDEKSEIPSEDDNFVIWAEKIERKIII